MDTQSLWRGADTYKQDKCRKNIVPLLKPIMFIHFRRWFFVGTSLAVQ